MKNNLAANFWLVIATLVACCGLYPAILLLAGKAVFPFQAEGSMLYDGNGRLLGSSLTARAFKGDEWFQPRPSAVNWNAAGSGWSN